MSSISPDTNGSWGDYCCASCNGIMNDNGTYPPLCSKECSDNYDATLKENKKEELV